MRCARWSLLAAAAVVVVGLFAVPEKARAAPGYFSFSFGTPAPYGAYYPGYAAYPYPGAVGPQAYFSAGVPWGGGRCGYPGYPAGAYYRGYYGRPAYPWPYGPGHHHRW